MHIIKYIISFITNFVHVIYMNEYALQLMYERVQCVPPTCISNTAGRLGWAVYCCSVKYLIFQNTLNARILVRSHSICCIYYIQEGEECIYIIYVLLGHCVWAPADFSASFLPATQPSMCDPSLVQKTLHLVFSLFHLLEINFFCGTDAAAAAWFSFHFTTIIKCCLFFCFVVSLWVCVCVRFAAKYIISACDPTLKLSVYTSIYCEYEKVSVIYLNVQNIV